MRIGLTFSFSELLLLQIPSTVFHSLIYSFVHSLICSSNITEYVLSVLIESGVTISTSMRYLKQYYLYKNENTLINESDCRSIRVQWGETLINRQLCHHPCRYQQSFPNTIEVPHDIYNWQDSLVCKYMPLVEICRKETCTVYRMNSFIPWLFHYFVGFQTQTKNKKKPKKPNKKNTQSFQVLTFFFFFGCPREETA